jgi:hypothetical protein
MITDKRVYNVKHSGNQLGELTITDNEHQKTITLTFTIKPGPGLELRTLGASGCDIELTFKRKEK